MKKTQLLKLLLAAWLFICLPTLAFSTEDEFTKGITVNLRNPEFSQGVLSTEHGGIITSSNIRIQAMHIVYTRVMKEGKAVFNIIADGNLMIEYGKYIFVGDRLEYDFQNQTGVIYNGRTMVEPWFFGGESILLCEDGSYLIYNGFVTTSPGYNQLDWELTSDYANLIDERYLKAKDVEFRLFELPVFYIPSLYADLDSIFDSPVRYNVRWGGRQGHRFGMVYEIFSWNRLKTFLRLDYRLKRGLGGGLETYYCSLDKKTCFETINYAARDSSIVHPGERFRYRFQGIGDTVLWDDNITAHLSYDKISDIDMPTDYTDRGLELDTAGRTELLIRKQDDWWISNLITRLRINNFQTIKQELPTFETSSHPFVLSDTGIISETMFKAAYLNFAYGNNQVDVRDYHSSRAEFSPFFYRNFRFNNINFTPQCGGSFITYGNSREHTPKWLGVGKAGFNLNTDFYRYFNTFKHVITPYAQYDFYSMPSVSPNEHDIFDIQDGWYRLSMLRFGVSQSLYRKQSDGCVDRKIFANVYTNAFFDTPTIPSVVPKIYGNLIFNTASNWRHFIHTGWDFYKKRIDHYNVRTEWTVNADLAIAAEFRHRSAFDWRKVDHTNFILDSFRDDSDLKRSQLSDRRDTFLLHFFYRFHPSWAFQFESRSGWNRRFEPAYNEFEIDLLGTLRSAWNFKISYQHKEDDDRLSVYFTIGINRPDINCDDKIVPSLSF